jgi:diguanylate cyclase (GGDEF)-like protein
MTVSLVFSAVMFRSLYGSHRGAAVRTVGYVAVYAAALLLAEGTDRLDTAVHSALMLPLPALLMSALTMRILFVAVQSRDAAAARQVIVAQTATRLLGVTDLPALRETGWQAQREVLRGYRVDAFLLAECADGFIVASGLAGSSGPPVAHADVIPALRSPQREPVMLREPGPSLAALAPHARWWYLIPTAADDAIIRILVLACNDRLPQDVVATSQVLMRQAALAFDALAQREELHWQASHDTLTRLANRKEFMQRLTDDSSRADTDATAVLFIDLDGFKAVNDRHGHMAGDELLKMVAIRLGAAIEPGCTVARLGGDEFAVLLPSVAAERDAYAVAGRLEAALTEPAQLSRGITVTVGASIGVHVAHRPYDADHLLQIADNAMYRVKDQHHTAATAVPAATLR